MLDSRDIRELDSNLAIGITTAEPLNNMRNILLKREHEQRTTAFEEKNINLRLSAGHKLENLQSIIIIGVPYNHEIIEEPVLPGGPAGLVARCARFADYHAIVETKAHNLVRKMKNKFNLSFNYRVLCDRSPLLERELAYKSGLGQIGMNCNLINPRFGSFTALGTILLDYALVPDEPVKPRQCRECRECLNNCPTGALIDPYVIDPYRCLSYLSQLSGIFPRHYRPLLENRLYGCDLCQEVCPHNSDAEYSTVLHTALQLFPANPLLVPLLRITQSEFDSTIGLTAAGWRGKTTIQRNAVIALGNSRAEEAVKPLASLLENDPRPVIRLHSAWALGKLDSPRASFYLNRALKSDPDEEVKKEIRLSLVDLNG